MSLNENYTEITQAKTDLGEAIQNAVRLLISVYGEDNIDEELSTIMEEATGGKYSVIEN